ncbi:hypothetical protein [Rhizobacter sp. Root1221]|uniref:hypothetical protein n=1 Tax=Rhizobacter sp. Root1221 TaxID=1736433 RepID=UPI0006FA1CBA|nr:hypothetical protein [Rhizobacter sp. Root1221]KQV99446.1 hypothetical protein ASC87_20435 [Rhizobacter sp. Root1221]
MRNILFGSAAVNHRRWRLCAYGVVALLAIVLGLNLFAPEPEPGSPGVEPFVYYLMVAVGGLAIYWMSLLLKLCEVLGMHAVFWMLLSVTFLPLSPVIIHILVASKLEVYLSEGGT